jgi:hypothetical protein
MLCKSQGFEAHHLLMYITMKNIQSSSLSMDSNLAFFQVSELLQFTQIHGKSGIPVIFFRAD